MSIDSPTLPVPSARRPRVLISAFACNPAKGSEPGLGYRYVRALAEHCDLTVITEGLQNQADLESEQARDPVAGRVRFHYVPWPSLTRDGLRNDGVNPIRYYHLYARWQRQALEVGRSLVAAEDFDLVHHLTMTGYREPGYLWRLPLPFVWGPVGGHVMMPWRYLPSLGPRGFAGCLTRNVLNWVQMRASGRVRRASRRAEVIFASTSVDRAAFRRLHDREVPLLGENGAGPVHRTEARVREPGQVLRLGWSGLHVPRKALPLLLGALPLLPKDVRVELHVVGDGRENRRWRKLASKHGLDEVCHFHGWLPRERAVGLIESMDAFVMTSVQDASSAVVFEALAAGLPVLCHACCGFVDVLTDECAILVPVRSPGGSRAGFAAAIERLSRDPSLYHRLSAGAIARARELSWENRAAVILRAYRQITGAKRDVSRGQSEAVHR